MNSTRKAHWEKVYASKQPNEMSWTQPIPNISLSFIEGFRLPADASIIDVGGGDSRLVDHLLEKGYRNLTVLDISEKAIERAKERLGPKARQVQWIECDISDYQPTQTFDCWHDRAAFHFLTDPNEVDNYLSAARKSVAGYMIVGTFSETGPNRCSMLDVKQYSEAEMQQRLSIGFEKLRCISEDHHTPFDTTQNFLFCSFRRKSEFIFQG